MSSYIMLKSSNFYTLLANSASFYSAAASPLLELPAVLAPVFPCALNIFYIFNSEVFSLLLKFSSALFIILSMFSNFTSISFIF
jgi:hypothetical protein